MLAKLANREVDVLVVMDKHPCEATIASSWCFDKHFPSTPMSQYARIGLHRPRNRKQLIAVTTTLAAMSVYMKILLDWLFLMRNRKRQMDILVSMIAIKVCIQSSQPMMWNRRLWSGWR